MMEQNQSKASLIQTPMKLPKIQIRLTFKYPIEEKNISLRTSSVSL